MHQNLLITSSINPIAKDVQHTDIEVRLRETIQVLSRYVESKLFERIFVVDGSGFDFTQLTQYDSLLKSGVIFSSFHQDSVVVRAKGKSYGELLINQQAAILMEEYNVQTFYKISGRWLIQNLDSIVLKTQNLSTLFYEFYPSVLNLRPFFHTSFYKITLPEFVSFNDFTHSMFSDHLTKVPVLEECLYRYCNPKRKGSVFVEYPKYEVISGTSGKPVRNNFHFLLQNFFSNRFGLYAQHFL